MVKFMLMIIAELENLTNLQPQDGCNAYNFRYNFKLMCGNCGEMTQKETYVSFGDTVPLPLGKGGIHLVQKCKFCSKVGTVTMITGRGRPLTHDDSQTGTYAPLMGFECRGFEPLDFIFLGKWKAESLRETRFEGIDLSGDEFAEYDEKGKCPVMISNPRATFNSGEVDLSFL